MIVSKCGRRLAEKQDFIRIAILVTIAFVIGVYLIATNVMIAQDGVYYIKQAQRLASDHIGTIKEHPPGYPILIFIAHKCISLFSSSSSSQSWIYGAQTVSLLGRLLSLIPLYFIGKLLVGPRRSFWAILVLIILPYPARFGSDVIRDWPHLLFLITGFWLLLLATKFGNWKLFGLVGLIAGLGYIIRPMCGQLVIYGGLWLIYNMFIPKQCSINKLHLVGAGILLMTGFAVCAAPYMKIQGHILPDKLKHFLESSSTELTSNKTQQQDNTNSYLKCQDFQTAGKAEPLKAFLKIIQVSNETLMYYFLLPLLLGAYHRLRKYSWNDALKFFMIVFISFNIAILIFRYLFYGHVLSKRYVLPLVTLTVFYVPIGLQILSKWLAKLSLKSGTSFSVRKNKLRLGFCTLIILGIVISMPKLLWPMRADKYGYKAVAKWLRENTEPSDVVLAPDIRINFYAERKSPVMNNELVKYVVRITHDENEQLKFDSNRSSRKEYSVRVDKSNKNGEKIEVFRII